MNFPNLKSGDKLPELVVGPFLPENLAAYAEASGDSNPLHLELPFARRSVFPHARCMECACSQRSNSCCRTGAGT